MSHPKVAKPKQLLDDIHQDTNNKRRKPGRSYPPTVQQAKKRRAPSQPSESPASSSDAEDEASDDDGESDEDEPLELAPSLNALVGQTGPSLLQNEFDDAISEASSVNSMFNANFQFENGDPDLYPIGGMNDKVFAVSDDDNDDEIYKAVDNISDSDDADDQAYEEQQLFATLSDNESIAGEVLNQIDGLSEFGFFGNESDSTAQYPPSSRGSDTEPVHRRHVRFDMNSAGDLQASFSTSPTISRALLPSALPENAGIFGGPASTSAQEPQESPFQDAYDCMLTSRP